MTASRTATRPPSSATSGPERRGLIVVKYGGAALPPAGSAGFDAAVAEFAEDLRGLGALGLATVVVHGGGREISDMMRALGKEPVFVNGRRVTDPESMDIVQMALVGRVNRAIVRGLNAAGLRAVGLCGQDAALAVAEKRLDRDADGRPVDLGQVGEVAEVDPGVLLTLLEAGYVPVVAPVAADRSGLPYNVNADTMAGALAAALHADCFVLLSDVPGLLLDPADPTSVVAAATQAEVDALIAKGRVGGGMVPKVEACLVALRGGAAAARIMGGPGSGKAGHDKARSGAAGGQARPQPRLAKVIGGEAAGTLITL
ncbi:MAG: acetylglutamate kinase [Bacillota bacterium]